MMRVIGLLVVAAVALAGSAANAMYAGLEGGMLLPSGGSETARGGFGGAFVGFEPNDFAAFEISGGARDGGAFAAVDALWRWSGFPLYDRYFGYSAWDPFFLGGLSAAFGGDGDCGPEAGVGFYYHLSDRWSLRFTAKCALGLEGGIDAAFALGGGVAFGF